LKSPDTLPDGGSSGFDIVATRELEEYRSRSVFCVHRPTGCEVLHLANDDPENLFAFAFRTPPADDTGVSHILEHSVLCGSKSFPLKDPFVVLLKTSLQTFLNAFTFPDKTVYPASSMVEKDFFNLLRVYGDAVFFPLLTAEVFMQEAHHLELDPDTGALRRVGVVYNEMKGVFSSVESVVSDFSTRSLFPDVPYGLESGGDPSAIPALTHEGLVAYHRRYYHPSNCRIFLYGDIPTEKTLAFLSEQFLSAFGRESIVSGLPRQPRWQAPRRYERTVPTENRGSLERRSSVTMNWLTAPVSDPLSLLGLEVLAELLVGNAGGPLHRRLVESGLGEDLSPATGLDTELNEATFSVGLRGSDPSAVEGVEELVLGTLRELAREGIAPELVEAAVHRVEFRNREIRRGGRPYSLTLMRRALRGWLHDGPPEATLEFRPWMDRLKEELGRGPYLESLLSGHLVDNPHRSTVLVRPDAEQGEREAREERAALDRLFAGMNEAQRAETRTAEERLREWQEREEPAELRARVPALHLSDLKREVETIPSAWIFPELPVRVLHHDLFTNGVLYVDLAIDTEGLPAELADLVPILARATHEVGLPGVPYHVVAGRLSLLTGGFGAALSADSAVLPGRGVCQRLIFRAKFLEEKLPEALSLVGSLIREADFDDLDRLGKIVVEMRNNIKGSLVPGGSFYASLRAGSRLAASYALEERWKGVTQYFLLTRLAERVRGAEGGLASLASALRALRALLVVQGRITVNLTCPESALSPLRSELLRFLDPIASVPGAAEPPGGFSAPDSPSPAVRAEALVSSTNVGYVARSVPASAFGTPESAHESLLAHFLSTGFLWEKVRMKGGAYGASASASSLERVFGFSSYRDPKIRETLDAFRAGLEAARRQALSAGELEQVVLGAVGREDRPLAPGEKGLVSLKRELLGISDAMRQERRDTLLGASPEDVRSAAERLLGRVGEGYTVVLTGSRALEGQGEELEELARNRVELPE
jgi:Zn-dependent M16 (insulinase) family peptidase